MPRFTYPAGAGINRNVKDEDSNKQHLPRRRGDKPNADDQPAEKLRPTPQARGINLNRLTSLRSG